VRSREVLLLSRRFWILGLVLLLAPVAVPRASSAVQIAITYGFSSSSGTGLPTLLGSNPITGLTATVVANVNTAGTIFTGAAPSLSSIRISTSLGSALSWMNATGAILFNSAIAQWINTVLFSATPSNIFQSMFVSAHLSGTPIRVAFYSVTNAAGTTLRSQIVTGNEVSRTIIPEPSLGALVALAIAAGAGVFGAARARRSV